MMQQNVFAQIPGLNSSPQDQQQSQQLQNMSAGFGNYKDAQKRFSIDYPLTWTTKPATNRFEQDLVQFISGPVSPSFADVAVKIVKKSPVGAEQAMKAVFSSLRFTIPNFQTSQDIECQKYVMDGNQACSIIYSRTGDYISNIKMGVMQVASVIGGDMYIIEYDTFPDNFDKDLPIVEQMISSFKAGTSP